MSGMIPQFVGPYAFLSNAYPVKVTLDGLTFPSVENAYQAAKTLDVEKRLQFTVCTATYARKLGTQLPRRPDWEQIREDILYKLLKQKFQKGTPLAQQLVKTGDAYLCDINNTHSTYLGACICARCVYTKHHNALGELLMRIREELL